MLASMPLEPKWLRICLMYMYIGISVLICCSIDMTRTSAQYILIDIVWISVYDLLFYRYIEIYICVCVCVLIY